MAADRYSSPLRTENARRLRAEVRRAARDLFGTHGFDATTIAQVAERAGVAPATVYAAFESKAGLVRALLEELEDDVAMPARIEQMFAEPEPRRRLRLFAASNRALFESGADVLKAAYATSGNAAVAELQLAGDARRRAGCDMIATTAADAGVLRSGIAPDSAGEQMWLLTSVSVYLLATEQLGWTPAAYEAWLIDQLERTLFTAER